MKAELQAKPEEMAAARGFSLTIAIPALNEEKAIASIIQRCLAARRKIIEHTDVRKVDIVVVSDGSTDRTAEIAGTYSDIRLVVLPKNQGYGAAIQIGWQSCSNELLAFLDADGTCDPLNFITMCNAITRSGFDIVLGSRMSKGNQMPKVRRVGNKAYALILQLLSHRHVEDTASGMRVLRRDILPHLMPLPNGLHFTPAMSARALLDDLQIAEIPMSYSERVGRSKLNVLKDGLRFLGVILATVLYVRPSRLVLPIVGVLFSVSLTMLAQPAFEYVRERRVEEWMIYRFLLSGLFVTIAALLLGATYIVEQLIAVSRAKYQNLVEERGRWWTRVNERLIGAIGITLALAGVFLAWPAVVSYVLTQQVGAHWSRVVTAMFCIILSVQIGITLLLNQIVRGVVRQQVAWLAVFEGRGGDRPVGSERS
jgi:glycosyltransferase involved in cell wall biosynthesis